MKATRTPFYIDDKKEGCCFKGCVLKGEFPAPKSRYNSKERYYFCLEHVKAYNKSWDFFQGMGQNEIDGFYSDSITGHRKTYKRTSNFRNYTAEDLKEELFREFNFTGQRQQKQKDIPDSEMKYMKILGLVHPVTMKDIKSKYKQLAKKYHPDIIGFGNEDKFKEVSEAYNYLKNCGY
jgi:hypothetical protein